MDLKRITPTLSVSPQIAPDDMASLKAAGFSAIICNRPDGEDDTSAAHQSSHQAQI